MDAETETLSPWQLLLIVQRRWRLLALIWAATLGLAALYTASVPRLYRPQATLEIRPEAPLVSSALDHDSAPSAGHVLWEQYYQTQEKLLTSSTLIDRAIRDLPETTKQRFMTAPDPIGAFRDRVDVEQVRSSFLLKVGFFDPDPEAAAQIANTLVQVYLDDASNQLRSVRSTAVQLLSNETLPEIRKKVDAADGAMRDFQGATGFIDFEVQYQSLLDAWKKLEARLSDVKLKRLKTLSELEALEKHLAGGANGMFHPAFHQTRSLEQLGAERSRLIEVIAKESETLKQMHPRMVQYKSELAAVEEKIKEAVDGTLSALRTDVAAAQSEEDALAGEQKKLVDQITDVGRKRTEYRRLEAELVAQKELYASYLKKEGDASAVVGSRLASVRVIDQARAPRAPFRPRVKLNLAMGALLGLMLGLAAILVLHRVDNKILLADETEAFVGLEVLSQVPRLSPGPGRGAATPVFLEDADAGWEFEAFRSLRAEVATRAERLPELRALAVVSALEREGKTTVTINLARAFALEGRRVLIFDADLRRPCIHGQFGVNKGPTLEDVLEKKVELDAAIVKSRIPGVDVVGLKGALKGAAEAAGTPAFAEALQRARALYDLVLIDTPPVLAVAEAVSIARRADGAVLVIREGATPRRAAQDARRRLVSGGATVLGAVHNCHRAELHRYRYGYGRYGYGSRPPAEAEPTRPPSAPA